MEKEKQFEYVIKILIEVTLRKLLKSWFEKEDSPLPQR